MTNVRVGQVWADNDPRSAGRTLRIDAVEDGKALCTVLTNADETQRYVDNPELGRPWSPVQDRRGSQTRVSLTRFKPTSTGYRLVKDI